MEQMGFFNTTGLSGAALNMAVEAARSQDDTVLALYQKHGCLTPGQVYLLLQKQWPLTSVRRSINTLTRERKLVKTEKQMEGIYGRPEHQWALAG